MQTQTTQRAPLLDKKGRLTRPSWATTDIFEYNKDSMRRAWRRKEWEFYQLSNRHFVLQLTYGHVAYAGLVGASLIDLDSGKRLGAGPLRLLPGDSLDLDEATGRTHHLMYDDDVFFLSIDFDGTYRRIRCRGGAFDAELMCPDEGDAICVATPFESRRQFYYNYKKVFQDVRGRVSAGGRDYALDDETFLLLDSGRGVWPYRNNWVWGSGAALVDGHVLALNLGWGFGRTAAASENALFWDGAIQKLERVRELCDFDDFMQPERLVSSDGRLALEFTPRFDNYTERNYLLVRTRCHQVFGTLGGVVTLDDGTRVRFDDMPFFIEHARNRW